MARRRRRHRRHATNPRRHHRRRHSRRRRYSHNPRFPKLGLPNLMDVAAVGTGGIAGGLLARQFVPKLVAEKYGFLVEAAFGVGVGMIAGMVAGKRIGAYAAIGGVAFPLASWAATNLLAPHAGAATTTGAYYTPSDASIFGALPAGFTEVGQLEPEEFAFAHEE